MQAFHNDPAIKAKYIARVRAHRAAEHLAQGVGWESNGVTRGCAIGCTLEAYDHARYPIELGLPEWLARLEDTIFEGLPVDQAQAWESFLEAIHPGVAVEQVRHKLAIRRLDRLIALQSKNEADYIPAVIAALNAVKRCHEAELGGVSCDWSAARSAAWSAAESAAESARSAARSAAWSAWSAAESAAWSARSAAWSAWSAWSAAESARSAAWSAWSAAESAAESARSAAYMQEAADLLELLRACATGE